MTPQQHDAALAAEIARQQQQQVTAGVPETTAAPPLASGEARRGPYAYQPRPGCDHVWMPGPHGVRACIFCLAAAPPDAACSG